MSWRDVVAIALTCALIAAWGVAIAAVIVCSWLVGHDVGAGVAGIVCLVASLMLAEEYRRG